MPAGTRCKGNRRTRWRYTPALLRKAGWHCTGTGDGAGLAFKWTGIGDKSVFRVYILEQYRLPAECNTGIYPERNGSYTHAGRRTGYW